MKDKARRLAAFAGVLGVVLFLASATLLYLLQSAWFKNKIRRQVIAQVELASGGRVELGSFDYDWRKLTADFGEFVIHGNEPVTASPLFEADRIRIGLKVISAFEKNIDLTSIEVRRPQINLLVASDGTTNLPVPRSGPVTFAAGVQALLNIKVRHFSFDNGAMQVNFRRIPLNVHAEDTYLQLAYDRRARSYDCKLAAHQVHIDATGLTPFSVSLEASGRLERDRLSLRHAEFHLPKSTIQASGALEHFTHPVANLRFSAEMDASDLTAITKLNDIGRGTLTLDGEGHYDEFSALQFDGKLAAHDAEYRVGGYDFKKIDLSSEVLIRAQDLEFSHLGLSALGSRFSGKASLRHGDEVHLDGNLQDLQTEVAATFLAKQKFPWSGVLGGPVHLHAMLHQPASDLTVGTDLVITPGSGQTPISGNLAAEFRAIGNVLEFRKSSLNLPKTHLQLSGALSQGISIAFDSTNLEDVNSAFQFVGHGTRPLDLPRLLPNGNVHFEGAVSGNPQNPHVIGDLALTNFSMGSERWDRFRSHLTLSEEDLDFDAASLAGRDLQASASGHFAMKHWTIGNDSNLQARGQFSGVNLVRLAASVSNPNLTAIRGIASGSFDLNGTLLNPLGKLQMAVANLDAYGERLNQVNFGAVLTTEGIEVTRGQMRAGPAQIDFSGAYHHLPGTWREGRVQMRLDSNGFPLASLAPVKEYLPGLDALIEVHGQGAVRITRDLFVPLYADGTVALRSLTVNKVPFGNLSLIAKTQGQSLTTKFSGNLQESIVTGTANMQLMKGDPFTGQVSLSRIQLSTLSGLVQPKRLGLPFEGAMQGGLEFAGNLDEVSKIHGAIEIARLELKSKVPAFPTGSGGGSAASADLDLGLNNVNPVVIQFADGVARVTSFEMAGPSSDLRVSGAIPWLHGGPMQLKVNGSVDMHLIQLFEPNVRASGQTLMVASVGGTLTNPTVNGSLAVKQGSLFSDDLPNGLTAVNGIVRFDSQRATIEKLTAQTGGGKVAMGGFVSFGNGAPMVYRLEAQADNVRVRYAGSVSVTATSQLRLTGTSENSILSGTTTISRVIFNPNTDVGNLLSTSAGPSASPSNQKDFLTGLQFDVHVESAPSLQLTTELSSDVEAEIDLRLRGTPERPIVFGSITANQGQVKVFGTKYTINRGEINFVNAVKIEPVVDLDLQTQARGVTVDIVISGIPGKFNINYRSDPPLQPRDIVALLTVGRTPDTASTVPNVSVTNDTNALQSGANTVLGQAIAPASDRLSKLFGITNIKIDPLVQGITNTPQARLTVEQQVSKQITVTYVTNLSETSEQIFRLEWDFSQHYSLVALRDDNGEFGIDIQYRKRFK